VAASGPKGQVETWGRTARGVPGGAAVLHVHGQVAGRASGWTAAQVERGRGFLLYLLSPGLVSIISIVRSWGSGFASRLPHRRM
jgi:hypothetical protein